MLKYVLLDYEGKWKNDVFRMFYHMTNFLTSNLEYTLIDTSSYNGDNKISLISLISLLSLKKEFKKEETHKILVIENHDGKLLPDFLTDLDEIKNKNDEYKIEFFLLSDDIHKDKDKKNQLQYYELFTKIFVNYYQPFFNQYPQFASKYPQRIVWMPHCVPDSMVTVFNLNPILRVGLLGNTAGKVYPHRAYLKELVTQDKDLKDRVAEKAHPSKKYKPVNYDNNTKLVGQTYFDTLNMFLCNFTCSLTLGYVVCKYFEIASTGSLLLCDPSHDSLSKLGFIDMETCVIYKDEKEIKEKILWILDSNNKTKVDEIRKAGMELVKKRHMVSIRCKEMDNIISLGSS